jgi:peptidoglycan/xylan/chitin deacetylase (PgdA/CDA1 family)
MIGRRRFLAAAATLTAAACSPEPPRAQGPAKDSATPTAARPAATQAPVPVRLPREVVYGPRNRPLVALTFHGAGSPALAEKILAAIERERAHATILAVGTWLDRAIADRITGAGHDLGNHTMHHLDISAMSADQARREIEECAARLHRLTGSIGSWFRQSASQHATPVVRDLAARAGYRTCLSYDVDSLDYTDPGAAAISGNVLRAARPGSIVSLHLGHPGTLTALPRILEGLHRRGLHAVTVSELLAR